MDGCTDRCTDGCTDGWNACLCVMIWLGHLGADAQKPDAITKIVAAKLPVIWKELDQMKRMRPTGIFSDHPFRSYNSLKIGSHN
jgi:uncharacterized metal-binding protein